MIFPLEQLVEFDGNIYEITVAASRRAYQMAKVQDPEIEANSEDEALEKFDDIEDYSDFVDNTYAYNVFVEESR